jgi:hypothetical protein
MANHPYREQPEVEEAFAKLELWAGRLSIAAQVLSLVLMVVLIGVAAMCVLDRGDWKVVATLVAASAAFAGVAAASRSGSGH